MASTRPLDTRLAKQAIVRCLDEVGKAILYKRALRGLYRAETDHGIDFARLSAWALYDQMFAHAIKVLHPREKAGLWYLIRRYKKETSQICAQERILLGHIRAIAKGLRLIRDKTHFHLDARGVLEPSAIWKEANITGRQFDEALDAGFRLLCHLHKRIKGNDYELPDYDGEDATRILTLADHADLFNHPLKRGVAVTYITKYGFWLLASGSERFLSFLDFPCFQHAPVAQILNVEEPTPGHYCWPDLDVDLSLQIIRNPERFPLAAKVS
jgi:hypothetical protein